MCMGRKSSACACVDWNVECRFELERECDCEYECDCEFDKLPLSCDTCDGPLFDGPFPLECTFEWDMEA